MDPRNGIAACPTHDAAFDAGLLGVHEDLRVVRAGALVRAAAEDAVTERFFGSDAVRGTLVLPPGAAGPDPTYLEFHLAEVFWGETG